MIWNLVCRHLISQNMLICFFLAHLVCFLEVRSKFEPITMWEQSYFCLLQLCSQITELHFISYWTTSNFLRTMYFKFRYSKSENMAIICNTRWKWRPWCRYGHVQNSSSPWHICFTQTLEQMPFESFLREVFNNKSPGFAAPDASWILGSLG